MVIDSLYSVWHPQVVNDIHQQGTNGTRIFIPPYMDPIEPNIDPILMAGVAEMGKAITWRLTAEGFTGVANNTSYDAWTPARAYQHYHGAIRILTETASAALASPITVAFDSLRPGYNVDPKVTGVDFLTRWPGGHWGIGDIVRYQTAATWALLAQAASTRAEWLASYAQVERNAVQGNRAPGRADWPATIVIPAQPARDTAVNAALRILQRAQVEVRRTTASFTADGRHYDAGSYVIATAQPYGAFAKALLERQHYPDLHEYPGGPPKRPYDVTAHTLPLLYGFDVASLHDSAPVASTLLAPVPAVPWVTEGLTRTGASNTTGRRIAIYRNFVPSMDEGWTRWVFDQYRVPFTVITARDVRAGGLGARFDAILLPDQNARQLARGPTGAYPDSLKGGLGDAGAAQLACIRRGRRHARGVQRGEQVCDRGARAPGAQRARERRAERVLRTRIHSPRRPRSGKPSRCRRDRARVGGVVRRQPGVHRPRLHARDGGRALSRVWEPAPLGLAARRIAPERPGGARRRPRWARARRAVRISSTVSRAEHGDVSPRMERPARIVTATRLDKRLRRWHNREMLLHGLSIARNVAPRPRPSSILPRRRTPVVHAPA